MIGALAPRLDGLARSSPRTATISRAKLARAYANAGQPADACRLAWETLDAHDQVGSHSAVAEIRRTLRVLRQWEAGCAVVVVCGVRYAVGANGGEPASVSVTVPAR